MQQPSTSDVPGGVASDVPDAVANVSAYPFYLPPPDSVTTIATVSLNADALVRQRRIDDCRHSNLNDRNLRESVLVNMLLKWLDRNNPLEKLTGFELPGKRRIMPHRRVYTIIDKKKAGRELRCHKCDTTLHFVVKPYTIWIRSRTHCRNPTCWALNHASTFQAGIAAPTT